jgi:Fe-S cluster assembly protein SufD
MSATATENNITTALTSWIEKRAQLHPSLLTQRTEAFANFQKLGLPTNRTEEYKYIPITRALDKNFTFSSTSVSSVKTDVKQFLLPPVEANVIVFINGVFSREHSKVVSPSSELLLLPIEEALSQKKGLVVKHLAKYADASTDAFTALNTASWLSGLYIEVPDNTIVEKPIIIYHIHDTSSQEVFTATRNLFLVGKSSEVTLLEKYDTTGNNNGFSSTVTEGVVAENSGLNLYQIQNDAGNRYQHNVTQINQEKSSRVNTFTFTLNGKVVRNNLQLTLDGEGIESHMYGLYLLGNETVADNHTVVDHKKANSFSNEIYKGILEDSAKGIFNGKIYVRPQAQKTNAFQANRNILLTDKASVNTKPQLEIWADDVKCSHGCTTGQLDEEALFYFQSRGINKDTARAMMLYAFAAELLDSMKQPVFKEYIDTLISERLHKDF